MPERSTFPKDELATFDKLDREADREFKAEVRKERRRTKNPAKRVIYRDLEGKFCYRENAVSEEEREARREADGYDDDHYHDEEIVESSAQGNRFQARGPRSLIAWLETQTPEHRAWFEAVCLRDSQISRYYSAQTHGRRRGS